MTLSPPRFLYCENIYSSRIQLCWSPPIGYEDGATDDTLEYTVCQFNNQATRNLSMSKQSSLGSRQTSILQSYKSGENYVPVDDEHNVNLQETSVIIKMNFKDLDEYVFRFAVKAKDTKKGIESKLSQPIAIFANAMRKPDKIIDTQRVQLKRFPNHQSTSILQYDDIKKLFVLYWNMPQFYYNTDLEIQYKVHIHYKYSKNVVTKAADDLKPFEIKNMKNINTIEIETMYRDPNQIFKKEKSEDKKSKKDKNKRDKKDEENVKPAILSDKLRINEELLKDVFRHYIESLDENNIVLIGNIFNSYVENFVTVDYFDDLLMWLLRVV